MGNIIERYLEPHLKVLARSSFFMSSYCRLNLRVRAGTVEEGDVPLPLLSEKYIFLNSKNTAVIGGSKSQ
jgi:hypothetical protein